MKCVVVIPIHTSYPSANQLISFRQCFKILINNPIVVILPKGLDIERYKAVVPNFKIIFIDPIWQSSLREYNKLKVSSFFYRQFKEYDYLLTYELDSFVFRDELAYWCGRDFDYIGAPWFEGYTFPISERIIGVGNSGFSLRKITTCNRILKRVNRLVRIRNFWFKSYLQTLWRFTDMLELFKKYFYINSIPVLHKLIFDNTFNEDIYWTQVVAHSFTDFKIATTDDAIRFSFDVNPSLLYEMNSGKLPFGCHAWERYEPEFWTKFINSKDITES